MLRGIRPGELDTQIIIESATKANDAVTNEPEDTWSTHSTIWAQEIMASKEQFEANQQVALSTARWKIRRDTTITERMRVNKSSVYYYISGIQDFGRQGYMIITAERRDND